MPAIRPENDSVGTARMKSEYRSPLVGNQYWPSPSVRELNATQGGMQATHAALKPSNQLRRLARRDIDIGQFAPILPVHKPPAENNSAVRQWAPPQIWKVCCIERLSRS